LLRNERQITVRYFNGSEDDAFLLAVRLNVVHGLPLTRADRNSAAERILRTHPNWSNRAIAAVSGLSDKTIGAIRRRASAELPHLTCRVGQDGRIRPADAAAGRLRAAAVIADCPDMPVHEIAESAGISETTARDVRDRLRSGLSPVPSRSAGPAGTDPAGESAARQDENQKVSGQLPASLRLLRNDPSLRHNETGRMVLRLLDSNIVIATDREKLIDGVPMHCVEAVARAAAQYALDWQRFAEQLENRGRALD
jgi:hypothetical protein